MRFIQGLELEIYIYTDEEMELKRLDALDTKTKFDSDVEIRVFYSIDIIAPYEHDERMSCVLSGGHDFLVKSSLKDLRKKQKLTLMFGQTLKTNNKMNVGELKKYLSKLPDDMPVGLIDLSTDDFHDANYPLKEEDLNVGEYVIEESGEIEGEMLFFTFVNKLNSNPID